ICFCYILFQFNSCIPNKTIMKEDIDMKKGIFTIAFIPLFFILIPVVHAENSKQVYQVGTNNLNVREAPNHDANIVGQVQKGDRITAFQEKHGWVQTYYAGKVAWVAS